VAERAEVVLVEENVAGEREAVATAVEGVADVEGLAVETVMAGFLAN